MWFLVVVYITTVVAIQMTAIQKAFATSDSTRRNGWMFVFGLMQVGLIFGAILSTLLVLRTTLNLIPGGE